VIREPEVVVGTKHEHPARRLVAGSRTVTSRSGADRSLRITKAFGPLTMPDAATRPTTWSTRSRKRSESAFQENLVQVEVVDVRVATPASVFHCRVLLRFRHVSEHLCELGDRAVLEEFPAGTTHPSHSSIAYERLTASIESRPYRVAGFDGSISSRPSRTRAASSPMSQATI